MCILVVIGGDDLGEVKVVGVVNGMVAVTLSSSHDDALYLHSFVVIRQTMLVFGLI